MMRRSLLSAGLTLAASRGWAKTLESAELDIQEFSVRGDAAFGRALLLVPRQLPADPGVLVLLHGLGETIDQPTGAHAFAERYGLLSAVARLTHPPLTPLEAKADYFGPGRLAELNARLVQQPFRCPVLVCPFTPNPYKQGGEELVRRFAAFLSGGLKSEVEQRVGVAFPAGRSIISGVSLGGYLAIEAFLQHPDAFGALGVTQGAFGPNQAQRYAAGVQAAVERVGPRRVDILTSSFDPYRSANEAFHRHLQRRGQASRLRVSPGPHDQRWLKESAVVEMLLCAQDALTVPQAE